MIIARLLAALAVLLAAPALAATLPASPATFDQVLAAAIDGDVIVLEDGRYADLRLSRRKGLTIHGGPGAVFRTFSVVSSEAIELDGFSVEWTPRDGDGTKTNVGRVYGSKDVTIRGVREVGQPVPAGTANALYATAVPPPPMNAFLVGFPAGRALSIDFSTFVTVEGSDLSGFFSGVSIGNSADITIAGNRIHHLRTTPVKGGGDRITIARNVLEHMTPYRYVDPATGRQLGDHLDFIHMFNLVGGSALEDLKITRNVMDASGAFDAIGILLEDNAQAGFPRSLIGGNLLITGNTQAISLSGPGDFTVIDNVILAPPGSTKYGTIIPRGAALKATGNTLYDSSVKPYLSVTHPENSYQPKTPATLEAVQASRTLALATLDPVDPRDATIATLEAQVRGLTTTVQARDAQLGEMAGQVDQLQVALAAASAATSAARAEAVALTDRLAAELAAGVEAHHALDQAKVLAGELQATAESLRADRDGLAARVAAARAALAPE